MDDKYSMKFKSYLNVKKVIEKHESLWSPIPAYANSFKKLIDGIEEIKVVSEQLNISRSESSQTKYLLKTAMANDTVVLVGVVKAFAMSKGDTALASDIDITFTDITEAEDRDADDLCIDRIKKAQALLAQLPAFGISQEDIDTALDSVNFYKRMVGKPKTTILSTARLNKQLTDLIRKTDFLLDTQLDNLTIRFKKSNLTFYNEYFSARRIGGYDEEG